MPHVRHPQPLVIMILLLSAFWLGACESGGGGSADTAAADAQTGAASSITFNTFEQGNESGFLEDQYAVDVPTLFVIRSQDELDSFWAKHAALFFPQPAPPSVDFFQEMIVALVDTVEPTCGYEISIQSLEEVEGQVIVHAEKDCPGPGTVTCDALTVPYHIVKLNRTEQQFILSLTLNHY